MRDASLFDDGFTFARGLLNADAVAEMIVAIEADSETKNRKGGVRNLLDAFAFKELAESAALMKIVGAILGDTAFVVRGILFNKTDAANWKVPWHQDVTIAVKERVVAEEYWPWSIKAGVVHVQPPAWILEHMISVRIHLDDCPASNGALRVLPKTHRRGKLDQFSIDEYVDYIAPVICEAKAGDALIMRPLLLHASSAANTPRHRRVLHFDYANIELAEGLLWRERRVFSFAGADDAGAF